MKLAYPVIITQTKDEKDTCLVYIPDIDGMTEGYGIADAIMMARDYIGGYLMEKEDFPKPSENVDPAEGRFSGSGVDMVTMVDIDLDAYRRKANSKAVRKNVSIPAWLDQRAREDGLNLSKVLQDALMEKMNIA